MTRQAAPSARVRAHAGGATRPSSPVPWGVLLALCAALGACRAREGERCVCAEDCADGLTCVAAGRVLAAGECSPAVGEDANPGVCLPEDAAAEDDGGGGPPVIFMDMGSKLDFEPGPPPDPETAGTEATAGTTDATAGTTDATAGTTDATAGTTDATAGTTDATAGTTDAGSTGGTAGSTGGTTDASTGSTGAGT